MPSQLVRPLYREVLGRQDTPVLELDRNGARVGSLHYPLSGAAYDLGTSAIRAILETRNGLLPIRYHALYVWHGNENRDTLEQEAVVHYLQGNRTHADSVGLEW